MYSMMAHLHRGVTTWTTTKFAQSHYSLWLPPPINEPFWFKWIKMQNGLRQNGRQLCYSCHSFRCACCAAIAVAMEIPALFVVMECVVCSVDTGRYVHKRWLSRDASGCHIVCHLLSTTAVSAVSYPGLWMCDRRSSIVATSGTMPRSCDVSECMVTQQLWMSLDLWPFFSLFFFLIKEFSSCDYGCHFSTP